MKNMHVQKEAAMLHIKNISWHFGLVIFFHVPKRLVAFYKKVKVIIYTGFVS
jgi:hypothetical protein